MTSVWSAPHQQVKATTMPCSVLVIDLAGEDQLALVAGRAVVVEHGDLPLEDGMVGAPPSSASTRHRGSLARWIPKEIPMLCISSAASSRRTSTAPHRRRRAARVCAALGLRADPQPRTLVGHDPVPPGRPWRRTHHRRRLAPPPRRACDRRRRGAPAGPCKAWSRWRPAPSGSACSAPLLVRRRRAGRRRPRPAPRGPRRADRPELHRTSRRTCAAAASRRP